ncbi:MAG: hypothetical protein HY342_03315 [Candidatus Lambdaproteobacteria bacterium]|nr:hypothetical protein [Candidatus Lambdaproteobacteria bacterium]
MTYQAETTGSQIIAELNNLRKRGDATELELASLTRKANNLVAADSSQAYAALGMIATIQERPEEVRDNFLRAIRLAPGNTTIICNYAMSLTGLGYLGEAFDTAHSAHLIDPSDINVLELTIDLASSSAKFNKAQELLEKFIRLNPDRHHELEFKIAQIANFMLKHNISEDELTLIVDKVTNYLHQNSVYKIRRGRIGLQYDDDSVWLQITFYLALPVERIIDLNSGLAEVLAELNISKPAKTFTNSMYLAAA